MQLFLKMKQLPTSSPEAVLLEALHAVRSLLCTSTNATPHKRFLSFPRRSMIGKSFPCWLIQSGPVLLRRFVRNKNEPLIDEVELMEANPNFAHIRYPDGRESTVSVELLVWPRALPKQLPFRNLILIMIKLRMMSSQPLPLIVLLFITVRDMNLFHQTQLIILSLLLPHPQTTLQDLTLLTLYFLSLMSYADLMEIPAPLIGLETIYI